MRNALFIIYFIYYFRTFFIAILITIIYYIIFNIRKFNLIILGYIPKTRNISTIPFGSIILFTIFYIICNITFLLIFIPFIFSLIILYVR